MHDALSVYDSYPARHALCGAHLVRELTAAAEAHPDQDWPAQARTALAELARLAATARADGLPTLPADQAAPALRRYRQAVLVGLAEHRRAAGRKQTKTRNLLERLRDREAEVLRFTDDLAVPFTNNGSERDLRPAKTQLKISGCHRSTTGADAWLRVRGYISTVRKHGDDILTALRDAITGNPGHHHTSTGLAARRRETAKRSDAGRARRLRLLRQPLPLLLGHPALPGLHRRRHADHVVSGPPQTRRTRGHGRAARPRPPPGAQRTDHAGRQGLRRARVRNSSSDQPWGLRLVRPDRRDETYHHGNLGADAPVDRIGQPHPQRSARPRTPRRPHPRAGLFTRIAARLLAMATGIWYNWTTGRPASDPSSPTTTDTDFTESLILNKHSI